MRHKKSKQSFYADETGRQKKKLRPKKSSARPALERSCDQKKLLHGALTRCMPGCDRTAPNKKSARQQSGSDRTEEKYSARLTLLLEKTKTNPAWLKRLQLTDLHGQTGQRQVQPVFNVGSTVFDQDGPGEIWLKAAELKFSSEVQLASSSWTRKFSWSSQLSFKWKVLKNLSTKIHSNFNISTQFLKDHHKALRLSIKNSESNNLWLFSS
jgi:hypothetical protein